MTSEPVLSLAEAARACGVSVSTMRRRMPRLTQLGAVRHDTSWRIPISALVAEGIMPSVTPPDAPSRATLTRSMPPLGGTPSDTSLEDLREQVVDAEKRAAVAEAELRGARALIDEKQRTIEAQAHVLRLLEEPRPVVAEPEDTPSGFPGQGAGGGMSSTSGHPQGSWWSRFWGNMDKSEK